MALRDYKPQRVELRIQDDIAFSLRGINAEDVSILVQLHKGDMDKLVDILQSRSSKAVVNGKLDPDKLTDLVKEKSQESLIAFIQHFPILVANIISIAADEHEAWETALALPLPIQIEALMTIARLTFEDYNGFKRFVGNVTAALQSVGASKATPQSKS